MYITYVNKIASPCSMHESGHSGLVHWDDPEGLEGEGGGRGVRDEGHMYTHGWFMSMYGKNHHNIVKQLTSNYIFLKKPWLKKFFKKQEIRNTTVELFVYVWLAMMLLQIH